MSVGDPLRVAGQCTDDSAGPYRLPFLLRESLVVPSLGKDERWFCPREAALYAMGPALVRPEAGLPGLPFYGKALRPPQREH